MTPSDQKQLLADVEAFDDVAAGDQVRPDAADLWVAACRGEVIPEALAGQSPEGPPAKAKVELNDRNYADWRKHILPDTGELAWQQIPWSTTFKDGIVAADAAGSVRLRLVPTTLLPRAAGFGQKTPRTMESVFGSAAAIISIATS